MTPHAQLVAAAKAALEWLKPGSISPDRENMINDLRDAIANCEAEHASTPCMCGDNTALGIVHRLEGPCFVYQEATGAGDAGAGMEDSMRIVRNMAREFGKQIYEYRESFQVIEKVAQAALDKLPAPPAVARKESV